MKEIHNVYEIVQKTFNPVCSKGQTRTLFKILFWQASYQVLIGIHYVVPSRNYVISN